MNVSVRGIARISAYEGVIASQTACHKCSSSLGMLLFFIMRIIMHFGGTVHFLVVFPNPILVVCYFLRVIFWRISPASEM